MHKTLATRPLQRRIIALAAAYAIALAALLGSFAAARAAAGFDAEGGTVTCHSEAAGQVAPADHDGSGAPCCADDCCAGCVVFAAALPQLPNKIIGPALSRPIQILSAFANLAAVGATQSHRSRAPPLRA